MLPESFMEEPEELARWLTRAFEGAAALPRKASKAKPARTASNLAAVRENRSV